QQETELAGKARIVSMNRIGSEEAMQIVSQVKCADVAHLWVLGQALEADRLQVARHLRLQLPWRYQIVVQDLEDGVNRGVRLERRPARETLVQDCSQAVHVRGWANLPALTSRLLGGHVRR